MPLWYGSLRKSSNWSCVILSPLIGSTRLTGTDVTLRVVGLCPIEPRSSGEPEVLTLGDDAGRVVLPLGLDPDVVDLFADATAAAMSAARAADCRSSGEPELFFATVVVLVDTGVLSGLRATVVAGLTDDTPLSIFLGADDPPV